METKVVTAIFDFLATAFDKIPLLNKLSGWRAVIGYLGLAVTTILWQQGVITQAHAIPVLAGFEAFKDLALNAKGRDTAIVTTPVVAS